MKGEIKHLHNRVIQILEKEPRAKLLELGAGGGEVSKLLKNKGFQVISLDIDQQRFKYRGEIEFQQADLNQGLPFSNDSIDYILMLEVIEHLKNPYFVLKEINRILKKQGLLFLSTPNILNLKSRLRFFIEGTYDYFREPPLDLAHSYGHGLFDIHLVAYKYPELEYILFDSGFTVEDIFSSFFEPQARILSLICLPLLRLQAYLKCRRSRKKGEGIDYRRIFRILLSPEILCSRHLIIKARKKG